MTGSAVTLALFASAVVLAAATTLVDSLPREIEHRIAFFWTSVFEETGELWSQLLFLLSFTVLLRHRLALLLAPQAQDTQPAREPAHGAEGNPLPARGGA